MQLGARLSVRFESGHSPCSRKRRLSLPLNFGLDPKIGYVRHGIGKIPAEISQPRPNSRRDRHLDLGALPGVGSAANV
jgi:hypothetical protein